ncbi:hypothetical protein SNEBB_009968 [Seison nebaliae]|nr:hypothetical protein SNEBB_009968 [Seison nebaliae]
MENDSQYGSGSFGEDRSLKKAPYDDGIQSNDDNEDSIPIENHDHNDHHRYYNEDLNENRDMNENRDKNNVENNKSPERLIEPKKSELPPISRQMSNNSSSKNKFSNHSYNKPSPSSNSFTNRNRSKPTSGPKSNGNFEVTRSRSEGPDRYISSTASQVFVPYTGPLILSDKHYEC